MISYCHKLDVCLCVRFPSSRTFGVADLRNGGPLYVLYYILFFYAVILLLLLFIIRGDFVFKKLFVLCLRLLKLCCMSCECSDVTTGKCFCQQVEQFSSSKTSRTRKTCRGETLLLVVEWYQMVTLHSVTQ